MPNIIDPVTEPSVLREPSFCMDELDFDALSSPLLQLQGKVGKKPQTAAIILAGGTGERFGKEGGKQLVEIAGKPILTWSAEAFDAVGDVGSSSSCAPRSACTSTCPAPSTRSRS